MKYLLGQLLKEVCIKTTVNNQYPVLTSSKSGIYRQEEYFTKTVASKDNTGYKVIKKGQFTYRSMSDTGDFFINCLDSVEIGIVSPAYPVFEIIDESVLSRDYLIHFFKSEVFNKKITLLSKGSTRLSLKFKDLQNVEIEVPSLDTQLKEVQILNEIYTLLDNCNQRLDDLSEIVSSRFIEMFVGKYKTFKIGDKFDTTSGGTPLKTHREYYDGGTIPWLTSGEVNSGIITEVKNRITKEGLNNSSAKLVPAGSVVVAMYGATAGKVGLLMLETSTNQAVCSILPNKNYLPMYVYYALSYKTNDMAEKASGGAQPNISQGIVRNTEIFDAPMSEQIKFVDFAKSVEESISIVKNQKVSLNDLLTIKMEEFF